VHQEQKGFSYLLIYLAAGREGADKGDSKKGCKINTAQDKGKEHNTFSPQHMTHPSTRNGTTGREEGTGR